MTAFAIIAGLMVVVALAMVLVPLIRAKTPASRPWAAAVTLAVLVPLLAIGFYRAWSNWSWDAPPPQPDSASPAIEQMLTSLEARLAANPTDVSGWLLLGRSYFQLNRYYQAVDAYQKAYTLTQGRDVEAVLGLGEALAFLDERMMTTRSVELFERALGLSPKHPKALWYSGLAAYQMRRLDVARTRWASLVALEPPAKVKGLLEDRIAQIDAELGRASPSASAEPAQKAPVVKVRVGIAPELSDKVPAGAPLFVLVRGEEGGGPPLAVTRRTSDQFPQLIELTDRDAMIAGRGLSSASRVTVVARVARSGDPRAQSGDLEGQVGYDVGAGNTVDLVINSIVP